MSSIESLKEKARRHEQDERWREALDLYGRATEKLEEEEQPDIGLYNRMGDLHIRLGNLELAAEAYEKAVGLYVESGLPNNAIAVCKKIVRSMPHRNNVYLTMGKIRADQGFLVDARASFLTYAERMQELGDMDEAFRALIEFVELAPDDLEIRMTVAEQLFQNERQPEAVDQLAAGYGQATKAGDEEMAEAFVEKLAEIDPDLDIETLAAAVPQPSSYDTPLPGERELGADFGGFADIALDDEAPEAYEVGSAAADADDAGPDTGLFGEGAVGSEKDEVGEAMETGLPAEWEPESLPTVESDEDELEPEVEPLPTLDYDDEDEEGDFEAEPLPTLGYEDEDEEGDTGVEPLPTLDFDAEDVEEEDGWGGTVVDAEDDDDWDGARAMEEAIEEAQAEAGGSAAEEDLRASRDSRAAAGDVDGALEANEALIEIEPDEIEHRQRQVELASRTNRDPLLVSAYLQLARALERNDQEEEARSAYRQVLSVDPDNEDARGAVGDEAPEAPEPAGVASSEEYVDLGGLVLEDEGEKTTRFRVAHEEPTGDEQADFAKMLSQFKEKVSRNLAADDVKAHHDLGTAYKEMGLLDEAIAEFQAALRASAHHLPTFELLGQAFIEKGQPDAAVRSLTRALDAPYQVEDELIGIYYHLGRAHEALGNTDSAKEFYDRVFSLDINFADVTERLRDLR
ncbi:MAG: tetratricopeptide repeat protein [Gemmatimonadota bacterium]|jgi:tetratricopeptide (TPR) repeat protein